MAILAPAPSARPHERPEQRPPEKRPTVSVNEFDRQVGRRIRQLRVVAGKSQSELAQLLGLTFQQVQKYEKGINKISVENLWRLGQHFGVTLAFFVEGGELPGLPERNGEHGRLRLELSRALEQVGSVRVLRGLLALVRSFDRAELED
jgi:transcriptional regulator with XRE-family HTH domain